MRLRFDPRAAAAALLPFVPLVLWTADHTSIPTLSGRPFAAFFVDVAAAAGLRVPQICGEEDTKRDIHEIPGTGVAFLDFDNDGLLDLFLVNGSRLNKAAGEKAPTNHLYRNVGGGRFTDVTRGSGLNRAGWGVGVCAGDIDNDGLEDLYVTYWGRTGFTATFGTAGSRTSLPRLTRPGATRNGTPGVLSSTTIATAIWTWQW